VKRREFITLAGGIAAWPLAARAQQPKPAPMKRIGVLSIGQCPVPPNPVRRRLVELGWIEGQTVVTDCVSTAGRLDQLPALARELVSRHPDVLVAAPNPLVEALKQETTTIPIVMATTPEPVRTGIVTNLARPEANVTGVAFFGFDILPKRIEVLKEFVPDLRRLAVIGSVHADPNALEVTKENLAIAANTLGINWQLFQAVVASDYDAIFARLATEHFDAAYLLSDPFTQQNGTRIVELALQHLVPAIGEGSNWARTGLLVSYGQNLNSSLVRVGEYIDRILRGADPRELPVEQATHFELVINLKTAKALGITVPTPLLGRADEVIE
jgi:putative ABC transport system substrate-binding protein